MDIGTLLLLLLPRIMDALVAASRNRALAKLTDKEQGVMMIGGEGGEGGDFYQLLLAGFAGHEP